MTVSTISTQIKMMWCHRITCNYFSETKPTGEIARYPPQRHQDENYAATRENPSQILHSPVRNNVTITCYIFLQKLTIPSAKSLKFPHKSVVLADESLCSVLLGWSLYKENNAAFSASIIIWTWHNIYWLQRTIKRILVSWPKCIATLCMETGIKKKKHCNKYL